MEEKQPNQKAEEKKNNRKRPIICGVIALSAIAILVLGLAIGKNAGGSNEEPPVQTVTIDTPYIGLLIPKETAEFITNEEDVFDGVYTYTFYLNYGDMKVPLWRVDFGNPKAGDWVGTLKTDLGNIPVVMTGFVLSTEDRVALGEEGCQLYGECMQGYTVMYDGIAADPRYTSDRLLAVGEDREVQMTYWSVMLPDNMHVSESAADGNYIAVFSGDVVGEMVMLYRIIIGDMPSESALGYFTVDGAKKCVAVEIYELAERESWDEDDYATAYRMMDTINEVINAIMSSGQFSN